MSVISYIIIYKLFIYDLKTIDIVILKLDYSLFFNSIKTCFLLD